jgi:anti-sigma-K factor RskA
MSDRRHDELAPLAAAYALGALDAEEREMFEPHLASCAICQTTVAEFAAVSGGLGLAAAPEAPADSLKARTLARAIGSSEQSATRTTSLPAPATARPSSSWLPLAAAIAIAAGAGIYAWALHRELDEAWQVQRDAMDRAETLRADVAETRRELARSRLAMDVLTSPDVVSISLAGTDIATSATGEAFLSPARGLVFSADNLPALPAGRAYQLWLVLPGRVPLSAGLVGDGQAARVFAVSGPLTDVTIPEATTVTFAVTDEPAAGSPGPTTPIVLAGTTQTRTRSS